MIHHVIFFCACEIVRVCDHCAHSSKSCENFLLLMVSTASSCSSLRDCDKIFLRVVCQFVRSLRDHACGVVTQHIVTCECEIFYSHSGLWRSSCVAHETSHHKNPHSGFLWRPRAALHFARLLLWSHGCGDSSWGKYAYAWFSNASHLLRRHSSYPLPGLIRFGKTFCQDSTHVLMHSASILNLAVCVNASAYSTAHKNGLRFEVLKRSKKRVVFRVLKKGHFYHFFYTPSIFIHIIVTS